MESDSDSGIEFLDQNYIDNDDDQELQNLKNNLVEQIENFRYEASKRYNEGHKLFIKLNILKIEVESEHVMLENLKLYCDILCELVKKFRESAEEINELNPKIKYELQKLEEKAKMVQEIEKNTKPIELTDKEILDALLGKKSEQESSDELDFGIFLWWSAVGLFIFGGIGYFAVSFTAFSLGVTMAALLR